MTDLRTLLKAATPGPWEADARVGVVAVYSGTRRYCIEAGDGQEVYRRTGWTDDSGAWNVDPRWVVDATLIVAAVNALPALLDVVDAARSLDGYHYATQRISHQNEPTDPYCGECDNDWPCPRRRLDEALERLETA